MGGEGSTCCGNACAAPGNECCSGETGYKFPAVKCEVNSEQAQAQRCVNREGFEFWCGSGSSCCGDVCVAPGGTCCQNSFGNDFPCGEGSSCCGNGCAAPGSKCCSLNGVDFPMADGVPCPTADGAVETNGAANSASGITCTNRHGAHFRCGEGSGCCGDICVGPGGHCCVNQFGSNFVCAPGSRCAGEICLAAA